MARKLRILIIGGGIGGMSAAIALKRRGFDPEIVEINRDWKVYHVGIVVQGNFLRAMASLGIAEPAVAAGYSYRGTRLCNPPGDVLVQIPGAALAAGLPTDLGLTRPALHKVLTDAVRAHQIRLRLGVTFAAISHGADAVSVQFTDGLIGQYDLVVGADGVYSKVRASVFGPEFVPQFTGQGVWRYNIPRPPELDWGYLYKGKPGGTAGIIPLTQDTMYVFKVQAEPGNPTMAPATLAEQFRERLEGYGGWIAKLSPQITDSALVVYRPLEALIMPAPWYRQRVLLIGDAAHSATPHLGQGAAMAVEDAVVLGEELDNDAPLSAQLEAFMKRRYQRARAIGEASIQLGEWEQHPTPDADPDGLLKSMFSLFQQSI